MNVQKRLGLNFGSASGSSPQEIPQQNKRHSFISQKITNSPVIQKIKHFRDDSKTDTSNKSDDDNSDDYETDSEIDEDELFQVKTLKQIEADAVLASQEVSDLTSALRPFSKKKYNIDTYVNTIFDKKKINARRTRKTKMQKYNPFAKDQKKGRGLSVFGRDKKDSKAVVEDSSSSSSDEGEHDAPKKVEEKVVKKKRGISLFVRKAIKTGVKTGQGAVQAGKSVATKAGNVATNVATKTGEVLNPLNIVDAGSAVLASGVNAIHNTLHIDDKLELQKKKTLLKKIKRVNTDSTEHVTTLKMVNTNIDKELMNDVYIHYPLFIRTSKQIASIDSEMVELGQLWTDMKSSMQAVDECLNDLTNLKTVSKLRSVKSSAKIIQPKKKDEKEGVEFQYALGDLVNNLRSAVELHDLDSAIHLYQVGIRDFISSHQSSSSIIGTNTLKQPSEEWTISEVNNQLTYLADLQVIETFQRTVDQLAQELCIELSQHWKLSPQKTKKLTHQLALLERQREALNTYLDSQEDRIKDFLSREIAGSPLVFVESVSKLFFGLVQEICDEFEVIFESNYNSEFVRWVVKQIMDQYCVSIETQVLQPYHESISTTIKSCDLAFTYADKLSEKGIAITYLLRDHFRDQMEFSLTTYIEATKQNLLEKMHKETWGASELVYNDLETDYECTAQVTETGKLLYAFMKEFADVIEPVVSVQLYQATVRGVKQLLESCYVSCYTMASTHSRLNDSQFFSMISTIQFVLMKLFPSFYIRLEKMFERDIPELKNFQDQTQDFDQKLIDLYCKIRSAHILEQIGFHLPDRYPPQSNSLNVSQPFQNLILFLSKLGQTLTEYGNFSNKEVILPKLMNKLVQLMSDENGLFWHRITDPNTRIIYRRTSDEDAQTIILDMYFLLEAGKYIMFGDTRDMIHDIIDRVGRAYYEIENDDDDGSVAKANDFYYQFIDNLTRNKTAIKFAINSFEKNFKNADFESIQKVITRANKNAPAKKAAPKKKPLSDDESSSKKSSASDASDSERSDRSDSD